MPTGMMKRRKGYSGKWMPRLPLLLLTHLKNGFFCCRIFYNMFSRLYCMAFTCAFCGRRNGLG